MVPSCIDRPIQLQVLFNQAFHARVVQFPLQDDKAVIDTFENRETNRAAAATCLWHRVHENNLLDARVEEGHAAHDARLVADEEGAICEQVVRPIP